MDAAGLRALQAPIKERYRAEDKLDQPLKLTERYCAVYQTITKAARPSRSD